MERKVDWSRAPAGATHYHKETMGFYKVCAGHSSSYWWDDGVWCKADLQLDLLEDSSEWEKKPEEVAQDSYTGGSSAYYKVWVNSPTTLDKPYMAECNDIIEALEMDFAEGNCFKAIWRKAKARQGVKKKGYDGGVYDSEKVVFFGGRMLSKAKRNSQEE